MPIQKLSELDRTKRLEKLKRKYKVKEDTKTVGKESVCLLSDSGGRMRSSVFTCKQHRYDE